MNEFTICVGRCLRIRVEGRRATSRVVDIGRGEGHADSILDVEIGFNTGIVLIISTIADLYDVKGSIRGVSAESGLES